jgi:pimeloyl-ACP methyl ester carboxylesterase
VTASAKPTTAGHAGQIKSAPPSSRSSNHLLRNGLIGVTGVLLALAAFGIGYQEIAARRDAKLFPAPGQMVDVGGYRLHVMVAGQSNPGPTVILDTGLGLPSTYMSRLQEQVAPFARVVIFDRPGIGWSEAPPSGQPHDALSTAQALHAALVKAGIPGPYVLAGHSAGGLDVLMFAATYPDETGGLVLLDSTHPDQFLRYPPEQAAAEKRIEKLAVLFELGARLGLLRMVNAAHFLDADELPPDQKDALQAQFASPRFAAGMRAEMAAFETLSFPQVRAIKSLGDLPLVVLTAGNTAELVPVQVELHDEYAALSTNSVHHIVAGASHANLVTKSSHLPAVTAAIQQVYAAARSGGRLQP